MSVPPLRLRRAVTYLFLMIEATTTIEEFLLSVGYVHGAHHLPCPALVRMWRSSRRRITATRAEDDA